MFPKKKINFIFFILFLFLNSCSDFKPLYKDNIDDIYALQYFTIVTDKKKASLKIKKSLIDMFPNSNKEYKYIIKIEAESNTSGTVSDSTRKISIYETEVSADIKIYYRYKTYDKLLYVFTEKSSASYTLVLNNIRSTLASRKKAEQTSIRLLSEEIYKRIIIYLASN